MPPNSTRAAVSRLLRWLCFMFVLRDATRHRHNRLDGAAEVIRGHLKTSLKKSEFAPWLPSPRYAFGDFVLEPSQQRVRRRDGSALNLTPRLFDALLLFVENAGALLDKDALMQALWPGLVVEDNSLSQVISGLRRALGDDPRTAATSRPCHAAASGSSPP